MPTSCGLATTDGLPFLARPTIVAGLERATTTSTVAISGLTMAVENGGQGESLAVCIAVFSGTD